MDVNHFRSIYVFYFHIAYKSTNQLDQSDGIYLCKLVYQHESLKIFVLVNNEWVSCSLFAVSELIESYSQLLGIHWIKFQDSVILALIFNRYSIYLERSVIFDTITSILRGGNCSATTPSPQISPILPGNPTVGENTLPLYKSTLKKFDFFGVISSFAPVSNGIVVSNDQGLGYIPRSDSMIVYIPELFGSFHILHAISFSPESSDDVSYSYILFYSIEREEYFILKATFERSCISPSFSVLPGCDGFQEHLKGSILNPYEPLNCSFSLIESCLHILISSKSAKCYSLVKISACGGIEIFLVENLNGSSTSQALLVTFNGVLLENEYTAISSSLMRPLFPKAISVIATHEGIFFYIDREKIPIPHCSGLAKHNVLGQRLPKVFIYDYKVIILFDHKVDTPISLELDLFMGSHNVLTTPFHLSMFYKILLGLNSIMPHRCFVFDLFSNIYASNQNIIDVLLELFQSQSYYREVLSARSSSFRLFCTCIYEDLNILTLSHQHPYVEAIEYLIGFLSRILKINILDSSEFRSSLICCLADNSNIDKIKVDPVLFPSNTCSFLFPRIYFFLQNWADLVNGDYGSLSSIYNFVFFATILLGDILPGQVTLNGVFGSDDRSLVRITQFTNFLSNGLEKTKLPNQFEWVSRISQPFSVYALLLNEKYRLLSDSISLETFKNISPDMASVLLEFFARNDIIKSQEKSCDLFSPSPPSSVHVEHMRKLFSLDFVENLTSFKLENDQSQIESFVGFENLSSVYLKETDLLKVQAILTEIFTLKNAHMPAGLLLISSIELSKAQPSDVGATFSSVLSQVKQKVYFSTHSTSPTFDLQRQKRLFEFLLCIKIVLEFKEKIDLSYVLSVRPKSKSNTSFTSFYHWPAFLFGLGLSGNFTKPYPHDVILEFISVSEPTSTSSSGTKASSLSDVNLVSASSFLLCSGISFIGSKDVLLTKSASMHFPSIVFSNHLTLSLPNFDSNIITYPIVDLPHHCVVISAVICSGLLYAQFPHLQLLKVFLGEFLYLFSNTSSQKEAKQFSFKNSGCRWYWSSSCKISKSGNLVDHEFSTANIYSHFQPITGSHKKHPSSDFYPSRSMRLDNQFYPYYLSRIKGFSLEGHSLSICFSLGISLFSIGFSTNISVDSVISDIISVLFLSTNKGIILNHPTVVSPLLLSLCMCSFSRPLKFSQIEKLISPIIMENTALYSIRMDILFNLVFYNVNSKTDNFRFDDLAEYVPSEVCWLLRNIGLDFDYSPNYHHVESFFSLSDDIFRQSPKFALLKRLLYSSHYSGNQFFNEIAARFHLPIANQFFLGQALVCSIACLTAYLFSKVLYFLKSKSNELPQRFHFLYYCLRYVYSLLDYPFYTLSDEKIILDPSFSFSTSSFNFKSICTLLMIQFETLITVTSLAHIGRPSTGLVKFFTYLQSINLSSIDIASILAYQKRWHNLNAKIPDFDYILHFSVLRSLFNNSRYQSSLSRSLGYLFMKKTDLDIFNYPISLPLLYVASYPIGEELIHPDIGYPDLQMDTEDNVSAANHQTSTWDRLPVHCRYFFLRLLKPSMLSTAISGNSHCLSTSMATRVNVQVEDAESHHKKIGVLEFKKTGTSFQIPETCSIMKLFSCMGDQGIFSADNAFVTFLPISIPRLADVSEDFIVLHTKKSSQKTLFSCSPSRFHNVKFPYLPLEFSELDLVSFRPILESFSSTLRCSSTIAYSLIGFFENLIMENEDQMIAGHGLSISALRDASRMLQICHYLYATDRLDEANAWLKIYFVVSSTIDCSLLEFRSEILANMRHIIGPNDSQFFKIILHFLSKVHPKNLLYIFFARL